MVLAVKNLKPSSNSEMITEDNQQKEEEIEHNKTVENYNEDKPIKGEIISYVEDYLKNNNLLVQDNLEYWIVESIKIFGYFADNPTVKYYLLNGKFKCNDKADTCVLKKRNATKNNDGSYNFENMLAVTEEEYGYSLGNIDDRIPENNLILVNEEV